MHEQIQFSLYLVLIVIVDRHSRALAYDVDKATSGHHNKKNAPRVYNTLHF